MTSKERAALRAIANTYETILYVGKNGIGDEVIKPVSYTHLRAHET